MNQKIIILSTLLLAHILLFLSFVRFPGTFWPVFTVTLAILIFLSVKAGALKFKKITFKHWLYIVISALFLYILSYVGIEGIKWVYPSLFEEMERFYDVVQPVKA
ncbi:hypothetical protein IQ283_19585 [Alkalihalobacillus hwajinpoensis]|nr:hypothetical protein [Pseudalkalibacillus hwajinpoensis]MBF0708808.1 hypothetical protein [Pseudalkalibacillus hwajinpoensis]